MTHTKRVSSRLSHPLQEHVFQRQPRGTEPEGVVKVVGAASPAQAEQIAQELQATWAEMARLADRWTQAHRQAEFPGRSLTVVLAPNRMHFPQPTRYQTISSRFNPMGTQRPPAELLWLLDQQPPTVLMASGATGENPQQVLPGLKRQMVLVFLSHLPNGQQMPLWVRMGVADYITAPPTGSAWPARMPPVEALVKEPAWGQAPPEHLETRPEVYAAAGQWIRYLLEGRDAQYAPAFVEALGSANPRSRLEALVHQVCVSSGPSGQWAPEFGQPVIRPLSQPMELGETERKLVFVLKLAWRFAEQQPSASSQPKVLEQGQDRSVQMAWTAEKPVPHRLTQLQQRILDPRWPRWATLDWNGKLLFSEDQAQWQAFFQELLGKYRLALHQQEGKTFWQLQHPEGGLLEAWLEANPQEPGRPIVCLRRSKP